MSTVAELLAEIASQIPTNRTGNIIAANIRSVLDDIVVSSVDPYNLGQYSNAVDSRAPLQAAMNACFSSPDNPALNLPFILPAGQFNISAPLIVPSVRGGTFRGAGRFVTTITNTAGGGVFRTNGFEFCTVEEMLITGVAGSPGAILFDLDWDDTGPNNLQSNTFRNLRFNDGAEGVRIAFSGFMGSENLFLNCFFQRFTHGLHTCAGNALQNTVIGGNIDLCTNGIYAETGSVPNIVGVGFQQNSRDIRITYSAPQEGYSITGCRSESTNFIFASNGPALSIEGCTHKGLSNGEFINLSASADISSCYSALGILVASTFSNVQLRNNWFERTDYKDNVLGPIIEDGVHRQVTSASNYATTFADRFGVDVYDTSAGAASVTIGKVADIGWIIGSRVKTIQGGTGTVTLVAAGGVTVLGSVATAAQYGSRTAQMIAADTWIAS